MTEQKLVSDLRMQHKHLLDAAKELATLANDIELGLYTTPQDVCEDVDDAHHKIRDISTEIRMVGEKFYQAPFLV